jgi:hypothetical protein
MMIGRRWVHHATLWTALSRVSTGFVVSSPVGCHNSFIHSVSSVLRTNHHYAVHRHFLTSLGSIKMGFATSNANAITASSFSSTDESSSDSAPGIRKERRSWRKKWRRDVGFSLSLVGFCQSAMYAVFTPHRPPKLRSAIKALRRYLRETSIDEEFRTILNHRLIANLLILRRIQRQSVPSIQDDLTQSSSSSSSSSMVLPCPFESLRYGYS